MNNINIGNSSYKNNTYNYAVKVDSEPRVKFHSTVRPNNNNGIAKPSHLQERKNDVKVQNVKEKTFNNLPLSFLKNNNDCNPIFMGKGYINQPATTSFSPLFLSPSQPSLFEQTNFMFPPQSNTAELLKQLDEQEIVNKKNYLNIPIMDIKKTKFESRPGKIHKLSYMAQGSFHTVFKLINEDRNKKLLKFINPNLNLTTSHYDGKGDYRKQVLETGYKSYKELQSNGFKVPKIYNDPLKDGYYVIEEILNVPRLTSWQGNISFNQLDWTSQKQLKQVREVLFKMQNKNELLVPDFKPHNVQFDGNHDLIIIDFCEDRSLPAFSPSVTDLIKEYSYEWANGNLNIFNYLMTGEV
ncbi:MAG: hypothetical protein H0V82_06095 [Candidatus Protochlamydia sp.]|nr:hypothetical protein [Candidatus Protochlamydia sp.]